MNARQKAKKYKKLLEYLIYCHRQELKQIRFETEQVQIETIKICHIIDDRVIFFRKPPEVERAEMARELGEALFTNNLVKVVKDPAGRDELQREILSVEVIRRNNAKRM